MPTTTHTSLADTLEAILDLSRLAPGELGDLSIARRILTALQRVFPGACPRVGLAEGGRIVGFAPPRHDDLEPLRLGSVELSPLLVEWMRAGDPRGARVLPDSVRTALDLGADDLHFAVMLSSGLPAGYVAMRSATLDPEARRRLDLLALHAGVVVENARLYRRLEREAETDGLTGALNYRTFMRALENEMDRVRRHGGELAVVMVDVDNLKEYNDVFGHLGGSAALREIAAIIREGSRMIDVVAKYGGDEFSVLLPRCDRDGARVFAERVRERIANHSFEDDVARHLTVSLGLAVFPEEGVDPKDLLRRADARLYDAKRDGRNRLAG
mgnify:CR=1 FL=1